MTLQVLQPDDVLIIGAMDESREKYLKSLPSVADALEVPLPVLPSENGSGVPEGPVSTIPIETQSTNPAHSEGKPGISGTLLWTSFTVVLATLLLTGIMAVMRKRL